MSPQTNSNNTSKKDESEPTKESELKDADLGVGKSPVLKNITTFFFFISGDASWGKLAQVMRSVLEHCMFKTRL